MGLTEERRARMNELRTAHKMLACERNISRIKLRMAEEIEKFREKYTFADENAAEKLYGIVGNIPFRNPARPYFEKLFRCSSVSKEKLSGGRIWICFLDGSEEMFHIFVSGTLADFLEDYDDWNCFGAFLLLLYDDLNGFIYIDDDGNMTEGFLNPQKDRTKEE